MVPLAGPGGKLAVFELARPRAGGFLTASSWLGSVASPTDKWWSTRPAGNVSRHPDPLPPCSSRGRVRPRPMATRSLRTFPTCSPSPLTRQTRPPRASPLLLTRTRLMCAKWSLRAATGWPAPGSHPSHSQCPGWSTTTSRMTLLAQVCFDLILNHVCIYWKSSQTTEEGKFLLWIITDYRGSCRFV